MLPVALLPGTYQQYKHDTNYLTNWLSHSAIKSGYIVKNLARNHSKKHGIQKYLISGQEIKAQAQHVASCTDPRIIVPMMVLQATKHAIESRMVCSTFYSHLGTSVEASNQGHLHFIGILQNVLNALRIMRQEDQLTSTLSDKNDIVNLEDKIKDLGSALIGNKFSGLEIEESKSNKWIPQLHTTKKARSAESILQNATFEAETNGDEEKQFELLCFFKDLCQIRHYLQDIWSQYKTGEVSLVVVSAITNMAIDCIAELEESLYHPSAIFGLKCHIDVFDKFFAYDVDGLVIKSMDGQQAISREDFQDLKDVTHSIYNFIKQGREQMNSRRIDPKDDNDDDDDEEEESLLHAIPIHSIGLSEILLSRSERVADDHKKLSRLLVEYSGLLTYKLMKNGYHLDLVYEKEIWPEDMISHALKTVLATGKIPIWTSLACRIYLDAHSILGEENGNPYKQLIAQAKMMRKDLEAKTPSGDWKSWMGCPKCPTCGTAELHRSDQHLNMLIGDTRFDELVKGRILELGLHNICHAPDQLNRIYISWEFSNFFEENILYCGTICLSLLLDFEMIGIDLEKRYAAIEIVAHFYHISKILAVTEVASIPELDNFIQKQSCKFNPSPRFHICF